MSLRFIHFSDTHLGFSELEKQDELGNNIREEDVYKSFRKIIDIIIERKPEFVIHSGDIFHRSSPTNKALIVAAQELSRLAQSGIPIYIIAGNHDFPKSQFTKPIHHLFNTVIKGKVFFDEKYELFETDKFIIHALPHINNENNFENEALKIEITNNNKPNILITHLSLPNFTMAEYGERVLPEKALEKLIDFNYTALGHWHKFNHIKKFGNTFYSGSTERFSLSEIDYEKGIIEVTIDEETTIEFIPIPTRKYFSIKIDDCFEKNKSEIISELKKLLTEFDLNESIVQISFNDLTATQFYEITKDDLNELLENTFHYSYSKTVKGSSEKINYDSDTFDLREQLNSELAKNFNDKKEFEEVLKLTSAILNEIEEEDSNADN